MTEKTDCLSRHLANNISHFQLKSHDLARSKQELSYMADDYRISKENELLTSLLRQSHNNPIVSKFDLRGEEYQKFCDYEKESNKYIEAITTNKSAITKLESAIKMLEKADSVRPDYRTMRALESFSWYKITDIFSAIDQRTRSTPQPNTVQKINKEGIEQFKLPDIVVHQSDKMPISTELDNLIKIIFKENISDKEQIINQLNTAKQDLSQILKDPQKIEELLDKIKDLKQKDISGTKCEIEGIRFRLNKLLNQSSADSKDTHLESQGREANPIGAKGEPKPAENSSIIEEKLDAAENASATSQIFDLKRQESDAAESSIAIGEEPDAGANPIATRSASTRAISTPIRQSEEAKYGIQKIDRYPQNELVYKIFKVFGENNIEVNKDDIDDDEVLDWEDINNRDKATLDKINSAILEGFKEFLGTLKAQQEILEDRNSKITEQKEALTSISKTDITAQIARNKGILKRINKERMDSIREEQESTISFFNLLDKLEALWSNSFRQ